MAAEQGGSATRPVLETLEARLLLSAITTAEWAVLQEAGSVIYCDSGDCSDDNVNAADTTNADQLRIGGGLGLALTGAGLTVGMWESAVPLSTHQELTGRVWTESGAAAGYHATHVAGTIAATGVDANARGMATMVDIRAYTNGNMFTEMGNDAHLLVASNHSFSENTGWHEKDLADLGFIVNTGNADVWYGDRHVYQVEDPLLGQYDAGHAQALDQVLHDNPLLLSVWSAGNQRNDDFGDVRGDNTYAAKFSTAPATFLEHGSGDWYLVSTGTMVAPPADGNSGTGYDSISPYQAAKNNLVVGAIDDVTADPYNNGHIVMGGFSSWGPADDGRVKPDVVANGVSVYSSDDASTTAYATHSGTSMSAPNVTGTTACLIELYSMMYGPTPLSATMKGILVHTAYDAWDPQLASAADGPDYQFGWGLVDGAAAANFIQNSLVDTSLDYLHEDMYTGAEQTISVWGYGDPIKATLVWNDPASTTTQSGLDDRTAMLVNDLNLWITGPTGTHFPWTLDADNPESPAQRIQLNHVDNVVQVVIDFPAYGLYTIHIGHTGGSFIQDYSLLVSGVGKPLPTPGVPNLVGTYDTGVSSTDNITKRNNSSAGTKLQFQVTGTVTGATVEVLAGGTVIGSTTAIGSTTTVTTDGSTTLGNGSHQVTARQLAAGRGDSAKSAGLSVTIDTAAPATPPAPDLRATSDSGVSGTDNITWDNTPTFSISGAGPYFRILRDGARISGEYETGTTYTTGLQSPDGTYAYGVVAVDAAGNTSAESGRLSVTIDSLAPTVPVAPDLQAGSDSGVSSSDNITRNTTLTFNVTGAAPYYRFYRGSTKISGNYESSGTYTASGQADGANINYAVAAVDAAGNESSHGNALLVTVDTAAPAKPLKPDLRPGSDSGVSNADEITNVNSPTFSIFVDSGDYFRFYRGGSQLSGNYASGSTYTAASQAAGTDIAYTIKAVDAAGNVSAESNAETVTIDRTAPAKPTAADLRAEDDTGVSDTDNITRDTLPGFIVTASPYYRFYRDGSKISGDYESSGTYLTGSQSPGTYGYTVKAVDVAGNVSTASSALSVTIDTTPPAQPGAPDLQAGSDTGVSSSDDITADDTPTFDVSASPYFRFYRGGSRISGLYESGSTYTAPAQSDGADISYTVAAVDVAGNASTRSAALLVTVDTVAPSKPSAPLLTTDTGVSPTDGITNDNTPGFSTSASPYFRFYWDAAQLSGDYASGGSYTITTPQADGGHNATVAAVDAAGNVSTRSDPRAVTIDTVPPSAPPAPDLQAGSDTGVYSDDNITKDDTPTFDVAIAPGDYFRVYRGGSKISGDWHSGVSYTAGAQPDGTHDYALRAFDAAGNASGMGSSLQVTVDTVAPTVPDWIQTEKLTPGDGAPSDTFACSVSVSGTVAIVGAELADDAGLDAGAAYIFNDVGLDWSEADKLFAADAFSLDHFGHAVAVDGDIAVVGAPGDDDRGSASGSAYVFKYDGSGGTWGQVGKLVASDGAMGDEFGSAVSVSGDTVIVGAPKDDDLGGNSGSAYIFQEAVGGWVEVAKLLPVGPGVSASEFGWSVDIDGDNAIVGAYHYTHFGWASGAAFVFNRDQDGPDTWSCVVTLLPTDGAEEDLFGSSVGISGNTAVVGAPQDDDVGPDSGSAYLFRDAGGGWVQIAKLVAGDGVAYDWFGYAVDISGGNVAVGAHGADDSGANAGAAYIFTEQLAVWVRAAKLLADDGAAGDEFGRCVSISGPQSLAGAPFDDDNGGDSGSAYVFGGWELDRDSGIDPADRLTNDATPSLWLPFSEDVYGSDSDVDVTGPGGPVTPDAISGWGSDELAIDFSTPLTNDGRYSVTLDASGTVTDLAGNALNDGTDEVKQFTLDTTGPRVSAFGVARTWPYWAHGTIDSGDWTAGRTKRTMPCIGLDLLVIELDEAVVALPGALTVAGSVSGSVSLSGMTGSGSGELTWQCAAGLANDRYQLTATGSEVTDLAGNALDGEGPMDTFPSGDGTPGGDWQFDLNVLSADATGDGTVDVFDLAIFANNYNGTGRSPTQGDFNGDATVDVMDLAILGNGYASSLPGGGRGDPAGPAGAGPAAGQAVPTPALPRAGADGPSAPPPAPSPTRAAAAPWELVVMVPPEATVPSPAYASQGAARRPPIGRGAHAGQAHEQADLGDCLDLLAGPDLGVAL